MLLELVYEPHNRDPSGMLRDQICAKSHPKVDRVMQVDFGCEGRSQPSPESRGGRNTPIFGGVVRKR